MCLMLLRFRVDIFKFNGNVGCLLILKLKQGGFLVGAFMGNKCIGVNIEKH
jgi:hypothetical protein